MTILRIPSVIDVPFVLVDCGARQLSLDRNISTAFPQNITIGFEPDAEECTRLNRVSNCRQRFLPVAVGEQSETRKLFVTQSPECSSLYRPKTDFLGRFQECATATEVLETQFIQVVSLDQYLPEAGITHVDLLKLDVQGAELDVLRGSRGFLQSDVLGLQIEVEFSEMYCDQPLFADVDTHVRGFQFNLFDLSRVRYRRRTLPPEVDTRGQLLWGDAFYLRDYRFFKDRSMKQQVAKLAVLASAYGFHDYALEILEHVLHEDRGTLTDAQLKEFAHARQSYLSELFQSGHRTRLNRLVTLPPFRAAMQKALHLHRLTERRKFAWAD